MFNRIINFERNKYMNRNWRLEFYQLEHVNQIFFSLVFIVVIIAINIALKLFYQLFPKDTFFQNK